MDDRARKCLLAELKVQLAAAQLGWVCCKPTSPARYDLILDDHTRLWRVQVKYADSVNADRTGSVRVNFYNDRDGQKCYASGEIDAIIVYVPRLDGLVWLQPEQFVEKRSLMFRLAPARSGRTKNIFEAKANLWWPRPQA